jgi:hypothetical protein
MKKNPLIFWLFAGVICFFMLFGCSYSHFNESKFNGSKKSKISNNAIENKNKSDADDQSSIAAALSIPALEYSYGNKKVDDYSYLKSEYDDWKSHYVSYENDGTIRIKRDAATQYDTVSEGIGYGMLLAVYFNDRKLFNGLWEYAKKHFCSITKLMHWKVLADGTNVSGYNLPSPHKNSYVYVRKDTALRNFNEADPSKRPVYELNHPNEDNWLQCDLNNDSKLTTATDGDLFTVVALIFATKKWYRKDQTNPNSEPYEKEALQAATQFVAHDIQGGYLRNGNSWGGKNGWNPSYFMPAFCRVIAKFLNDKGSTSEATIVNQMITNMYKQMDIIDQNNSPAGLHPDWVITQNGKAEKCLDLSARRYYQPADDAFEYTITYRKNDWGSGFTANVKITNKTGSDINGWKLTWTFAGNQKITQSWNSKYSQSGKAVTITNDSWNKVIPNNGSVDFGFNASYSGSNVDPVDFLLNGKPSTPPGSGGIKDMNNDGKIDINDALDKMSFNCYYDGVRVPFNMALDYSWYGIDQAYKICQKVNNFTYTKLLNNTLVDGYSITGGPWKYEDCDGFNLKHGGINKSVTFYTCLSAPFMATIEPNRLGDIYNIIKNKKEDYAWDYNYFGNCWRILAMTYMNGLFTNQYDCMVTLKCVGTGTYLSVTADNDAWLKDSQSVVGNQEKFEIINLGNNRISIRSCYSTKYVCTEGHHRMRANRINNAQWETFDLVKQGTNTYALKSSENLYVTLHPENSSVIADSSTIGPNQTFVFTLVQ